MSALMLTVANTGLAETARAQVSQPAPVLQLSFAQATPARGFVRKEFIDRHDKLYVAERSVLADDAIEQVIVRPTSSGLVFEVFLSAEGAARLADATKSNVGRQLAVLVHSQLASATQIAEPLSGSQRILIALSLPKSSADKITAAVTARWPQLQ
jgi:preprotein translocase subunit SecD